MNDSNLWGRIKARHLQSNVYTLVAFFILFVAFTVLYVFIPNGLPGEIFIAISTSLLASLFIGFFDIYTEYKNFENAQFIDNLYTFGIHNLYFEKEQVLERLIDKAQHEIWISGYRLILTRDLAKSLYRARQSGVTIRMLICPAWTETYRLIYKDAEASLENYLSIINVLCHNDDNPQRRHARDSLYQHPAVQRHVPGRRQDRHESLHAQQRPRVRCHFRARLLHV